MKLNCMIVDDEPLARKVLTEYIEDVDFLELKGKAENPVKANSLLTDNEIDLIRNSTGGLTLMDIMPIDRHETFAGMDAATLQQFMPNVPAEIISEYLRDGQPKADDDDPDDE